MGNEQNANVDARGRRKSSPAAELLYSHKIRNINDPGGALEEEINKTAKRLCRAKAAGNVSRQLVMRQKLASKCMSFFYVTGVNVSACNGSMEREGQCSQFDDIFIDTLMQVIDTYDANKGSFTHMLRMKYAHKRTDAAYAAAKEDTQFGGGNTSAPLSLDAALRQDDDGSSAVVDVIPGCASAAQAEDAAEERDLSGSAHLIIMLKTVSLISEFLGKTGRAANDTRKLYTKMFFSETLTRVTKLHAEHELAELEQQERIFFKAVEILFQDSYTVDKCRTIKQLWQTEFVEGVRAIERPFSGDTSRPGASPDYGWHLPAKVYISYLQSIGESSSNASVSQQRSRYQELLKELMA